MTSTEVIYLNEVKFRNQLRKDLKGKGVAPVANKSDRYSAGYVQVAEVFGQPEWFKVSYYSYSNKETAQGRYQEGVIKQRLSQMLHLSGYEAKLITEQKGCGEQEQVIIYRKASN